MPVTMSKTPSHGSSGKSIATKVPFKKVFSSSHLQTNGLNRGNGAQSGRLSIGFASMAHNTLTSQLSSSLPGILDNVNSPTKVSDSGEHRSSLDRSSQEKSSSKTQGKPATVINTPTFDMSPLVSKNGIPFSAMEPSLFVSLSTYLNSLKHFDSSKLVKEIELMLKYFEDAVKKDKLELLAGSTTILLETVDSNSSKLKNAYLQLQQVQLQLHLMSNINLGDDAEPSEQSPSLPVIEATNDLYRSLSELLQWSDEVCSQRELLMSESASDKTTDKTEKRLSSTASKQHIETVTSVSHKLLHSFKNLVKAYKQMESELRQWCEHYLSANKKLSDWILSENSNACAANASPTLIHSLRRNSVTPPPDYNRDSAGLSSSQYRVPNGSTSTLASSTSSGSSSSSSNFLSKHRFLPNVITNQAQKMAQHFELKKLLSKSGSKEATNKSNETNNVDKHSFSLLPLFHSGSNLKRSESASNISLVPQSFIDIPVVSLGATPEPNLNSLARAFRKRSINDQRRTPEMMNLADKMSKETSQSNRHSDGSDGSQSKVSSLVPSKDMLFNPLYFTPRFQSQHSISTDNLNSSISIPGACESPSSLSPSTQPRRSHQLDSSPLASNSFEADKPPPLPPKTYQFRSISSTRSSIASNTSSSSSCSSSKDSRRPSSKDTDSGLGTMPSCSSIELPKEVPKVLRCCNQTTSFNTLPNSNNRSAVSFGDSAPENEPSNEPLVKSVVTREMDISQVTLRAKKTRISSKQCSHCTVCRTSPRSSSPPPLPPPESYLFQEDNTLQHSSQASSGCTFQATPCCAAKVPCCQGPNKENCSCLSNVQCHTRPQCGMTCSGHPCQPLCCCARSNRQVRTYRRQTKTQSMTMAKSYRSYSIDESSASSMMKCSLTTNSINAKCFSTISHSTSFPHRTSLCHSMSICESSLPPPLPPKRRNMHAYMVVVGNYSAPSDSSELYYYRSNFTKSLIEAPTVLSPRQNSTSSSIMSLSSSASSSSSLSTNSVGTSFPTVADNLDRQQYQHLPMAPPPPIEDPSGPSDTGPSTPPPPLLPPRRDKSGTLPLAPPPPPPISSVVVQQQRLQQIQTASLVNSPTNTHQQIVSPRSSTPVKRLDSVSASMQGETHHHCPHCGSPSPIQLYDAPEPSFDSVDEETETEPTHELEMLVEEEDIAQMDQSRDDVSSTVEQEVEEATSPSCSFCSDGTLHAEEECILSQIDVPPELLAFRSPDDDDDTFGDLDIRGGTVDALLLKATQTSPSGVDATFLDTFLTTYRTFLSPHQLINKLIFRYHQFAANTERTDIVRQSVAQKVVAFITLLFNEIYLYDFDKSLQQTLMEFIYQLVGRGDLAHAKCLREKCYEKIRQRDLEFAAAAVKLQTHNITTRTATLLDFKSEHLAEQMTLLDSRLFQKIEIPEILIWAKEQKEELIPNLSTFTEHFNKMSFWTRSQILRCEEHKEREKYVLKFLKIMKHLRKLNNFNSYLAILSALCSAPIHRLDWAKNITETLKEYNALIDSSSSFRTYRTALAMAKPPCIPYIGLILQDLTFVHIGNSDFLPDGKINYGKRYKQYSILSQMKQFKQCKYPLVENEAITLFFDNFNDYLHEDVMWQISESIKPRGGGAANHNNNNNNNTSLSTGVSHS